MAHVLLDFQLCDTELKIYGEWTLSSLRLLHSDMKSTLIFHSILFSREDKKADWVTAHLQSTVYLRFHGKIKGF